MFERPGIRELTKSCMALKKKYDRMCVDILIRLANTYWELSMCQAVFRALHILAAILQWYLLMAQSNIC